MNSYYEKFANGDVKCINDEIPFETPKGWEWVRLYHVFSTSSGSTPQSNNPVYYSNGTINWVRTTDLNNDALHSCRVKITRQACSDYNLSIIPRDSICIAMYGGAGTIGKHSIIKFDTTINQSVCAIHPNGYCNMDYIHIYLQYYRPFWMDKAAGSRKDPNINQIIIKNCLLPIPPKKEQDQIALVFSELSPLIEKYGIEYEERRILNKRIVPSLWKSILQEAIRGSLVRQDTTEESASILLKRIVKEKERLLKDGIIKKKDCIESIIFKGDDNKYYERIGGKVQDISDEITYDIPDSWCWARLSTIANLFTGNSINETEKKALYTNVSGKDYIGTKDIGFNSRIEYSNGVSIPDDYLTRFKIATSGSILLCVEGGSAGRKIAILEKDVCFGNKLCCVSPYVAISQYLFFYLQSPAFYDVFQKSKTGIIGGVSVNTLKDLIVAIPPIREQDRIVQKIKALSL